MGIPFDQLKQKNDIVDVVSRHVTLQKRGGEYYGICPFHDDSKASLQVNPNKQLFKCFACGAGGDVFDFLTSYGKTVQEAAEILGKDVPVELGVDKKRTAKKAAVVKWVPVPASHPPTSISHYLHGEPSATWVYKAADGKLLGYVCRFNTPEGKEVIPYTLCTDGKRHEWRWQGFAYPRPIYGLELLAQHPDKTVIIVEGEKCADAINANMETAIGIAWPGGAQAIKHVDWSPLNGRKVILWPDHDTDQRYGDSHPKAGQLKPWFEQPGNAAMLEIAALLQPHVPVLRWISVPADKPNKWDVADHQWQGEELREFVRKHLASVPVAVAEPEPPAAPAPPEPEPEPTFEPAPPDFDGYEDEPSGPVVENPHFRFLGYVNEGSRPLHCFYPNGNKLIVKLNTSQMTRSSLIDLAPLSYWEHHFPAKKGFDVDAATNWLSAVSQQVGIFSTRNIRGRGAWSDEGRTVVHSGSHLVVDGQQSPLGKLRTKFIYEVGEPLGFSDAKPLQPQQASKLVDVLKLLNWDREINAYLLAGWCVVAPICGALKWRPHVWITGGAGTGKSWVFKELVRKLLGETCLAVQGETSEAGLRQSLGHDALPVVFDEAEAEDKRSQERIQTILTLMRAASADDGGVMAKGSAGGNAVTYRIRSCFAFASISVSLSQQSDRSRVTILSLRRLRDDDPVRIERWKKLQALYHELITDDFVQRLQARTLTQMNTITRNAQTFANAAAAVIGAQRTGDQLGALLAGAYSLFSSKVISYEEAVEWVRGKDWSEERSLDATRDEQVLFSHLMEQLTQVETDTGRYERQIGELVLIASYQHSDALVGDQTAHSRLKRLGIKIDGDFIVISNSADPIRRMLNGTSWSKNHNRILLRIDGAREYPSTKFAAGLQTRAVGVPLSLVSK